MSVTITPYQQFLSSRQSPSTFKNSSKFLTVCEKNDINLLLITSQEFKKTVNGLKQKNGQKYALKTIKIYFSELSCFVQFCDANHIVHLHDLNFIRNELTDLQHQIVKETMKNNEEKTVPNLMNITEHWLDLTNTRNDFTPVELNTILIIGLFTFHPTLRTGDPFTIKCARAEMSWHNVIDFDTDIISYNRLKKSGKMVEHLLDGRLKAFIKKHHLYEPNEFLIKIDGYENDRSVYGSRYFKKTSKALGFPAINSGEYRHIQATYDYNHLSPNEMNTRRKERDHSQGVMLTHYIAGKIEPLLGLSINEIDKTLETYKSKVSQNPLVNSALQELVEKLQALRSLV
jgi:hypothetical protein